MTIPFFNTSLKTDILALFLLTPLWWLLGFGIFIYQGVTFLVFIKLWGILIDRGKYVKVPTPAIWLGMFLAVYLASILINFHNYPLQRVLASFNNYLLYVMGFLLIITVYECEPEGFLRTLCRAGRLLCLATGIIAVLFLGIWFWGDKSASYPTLISRLMPSLTDYPFFYNILTIRITGADWIAEKIPRISIYSAVITGTAGFMLMVLPLASAAAFLEDKKRPSDLFIYAIGLVAMFSALSRTAICAYFGAMVVVWMVEKKQRFFVGIILVGLSILSAGWLYDGIQWLFESRSSSTVGRVNIYWDAIRIAAEENFLIGIGVRIRDEFTMMSIGSHSTHVGIFLMSGILGLLSFVLFQGFTLFMWLRIQTSLLERWQIVLWRYLGTSFIAVNIWILTDGVDGVPFITFTYFLIAASLILLGRSSSAGVEQRSRERSVYD